MPELFSELNADLQESLKQIAKHLVQSGKGIFAADESIGNIGSKFKSFNLENTAENRCKYRDMLFSINGKAADGISGVILVGETLGQKRPDGTLIVENLKRNKIKLGIKLDKGVYTMPNTHESCTYGLDSLDARCKEYKKLGCDFAKWRCTFKLNSNTPSNFAITKNANVLAEYASVCQENGLVPIVEPELLMDGDHNIESRQKATEVILSGTFKALNDHNVLLEGMLIKTNMVTPGNLSAENYTPNDVAIATLTALKRSVPPAVPGIVFLSGGQSEQEATRNLDAINKAKTFAEPWALTFSFSRGLQASALRTWAGKDENIRAAQTELARRIEANSLATLGQYAGDSRVSSEGRTSQFVVNHRY